MRLLTPEEQDAVAAMILEYIRDDRKWEAAMEGTTEEEWSRLADSVRKEIDEGKTEDLESRH